MKPVVIFDNIIFSLQKAGGISAFWSNLTKRVEASGMFNCHYIEYPGSERNIFRKSLSVPEDKIISGRHLPFSAERLLEPWIPPELIAKPFIFHSSYYRTFSNPNANNIATFHDLTHEHGGDGNFITRPLMRRLHAKALEKSRQIVCVSQSCLTDITTFFPRYSEKPISVAYNAPVNVSKTDISDKSPDNYLLFVGARDDYKNFNFAVTLASECGLRLKVAGAPFTSKEKKYIASVTGSEVELYCFPEEKELCTLYANARALIFMSEYEGFGIPITEAQMHGCPVITLRKSAIPEIAGRGAMICDNLDLNEVATKIKHLEDPAFRNEIIRLGKENVKRFSWDYTASQYIEIYDRLLRM